MTTMMLKEQKLCFNDVARAVSHVNALGRVGNLEQKRLEAEDVQKIIHFTSAVSNKQCQMLRDNAVTLVRLVPSLFAAKSSATVHRVIGLAVPVVKELYEQDPNSEAGQRYRTILENAAKVCFHPRLTATTQEKRLEEFEMFKSVAGDTAEYKQAFLKYRTAHMRGLRKIFELSEAPNAIPRSTNIRRPSWNREYS